MKRDDLIVIALIAVGFVGYRFYSEGKLDNFFPQESKKTVMKKVAKKDRVNVTVKEEKPKVKAVKTSRLDEPVTVRRVELEQMYRKLKEMRLKLMISRSFQEVSLEENAVVVEKREETGFGRVMQKLDEVKQRLLAEQDRYRIQFESVEAEVNRKCKPKRK